MTGSLPFGSTEVPVPGFGAMCLSSAMGSNLSLEEAEPVLQRAIDLGCTFWDTAVCCSAKYGHQTQYLTVKCPGRVPQRCQREAARRLHQEAQHPRQGLWYFSAANHPSLIRKAEADHIVQLRPSVDSTSLPPPARSSTRRPISMSTLRVPLRGSTSLTTCTTFIESTQVSQSFPEPLTCKDICTNRHI